MDMHLSTDASREGTAEEKQLMQNHAAQDPCKIMQNGKKSKALKLEGKERFEPQAATQQLRAPV